MKIEIVDITQELLSGNVYEGDSAPQLVAKKDITKDGYALSDLYFCLHNATHIDAPSHTASGGISISNAPLSAFFGKCVVCFAQDAEKKFCEKMLFKGTPPDAALAKKLVEKGLTLAGTSSPSFDEDDSIEVHRIFAESGVFLLENLLIEQVEEGEYVLCSFPLKIDGAEASPVRAVLFKASPDAVL